MIKVNSVDIPTPSECSVAIMDIDNPKTARSASGLLIRERVAVKRKIELSWKYLSASDISTLLNQVSNTSFTVEYPDPKDGAMRTGTFYVGDRTNPFRRYVPASSNGDYKDVKMNFIEY